MDRRVPPSSPPALVDRAMLCHIPEERKDRDRNAQATLRQRHAGDLTQKEKAVVRDLRENNTWNFAP